VRIVLRFRAGRLSAPAVIYDQCNSPIVIGTPLESEVGRAWIG
jgi:hypothetical protein